MTNQNPNLSSLNMQRGQRVDSQICMLVCELEGPLLTDILIVNCINCNINGQYQDTSLEEYCVYAVYTIYYSVL